MTDRDDEAAERAWRSIVDNYGERPVLPDPDPGERPDEPDPGPPTVHATYDDHDEPGEPDEPDEEGFVPPEPPPLPQPPRDQLVAWVGVLGVPLALVALLLAGVHVASWFALLMVAGFTGGFGYLVARMPRGPRDPWDDGSRL